MGFLIRYHRPTQTTQRLIQSEDLELLTKLRFELELVLFSTLYYEQTEVIVLEADSIEIARRTHSRYFARINSIIEY